MTPYDNRGYLHPFWNGNIYLYGVGELPRTLTELAMCQLSASIRSNPGWQKQLQDPKYRKAWRRQARRIYRIRTSSETVDVDLSHKQIDFVLGELAGYEKLYDALGRCQVACFDRMWETTGPIASDVQLRLRTSLSSLRTRPGGHSPRPSFRPREGVRRDLIDPYLYPVVYGQTLAMDSNGTLSVIPSPEPSAEHYGQSQTYTCLPTSFSISSAEEPLCTRALSYIPGLEPSMHDARLSIEQLLASTVPLFEHVLTDLSRDNPLPHRIPGDYKYTEWEEPDEPDHSDDEEGWYNYQRELRYWTLHRPIQYPDVPAEGYVGGLEKRHSESTLRGRTVMVYIQVSDIHLAPGASYDGTPWHAEGMRNERVAAVAIHCVAMHNVTPLTLDIRMPVRSPRKFLLGDAGATSRAWGLCPGSPSQQYVGTQTVREGHTVVFPNIYQYRLNDVRLEDPSAEGTLTFLTFCLVDPEISQDGEVLSTASVPPQYMQWTREALEDSIDIRIPTEIIDKIMSFVDGLMSYDEALRHAERMKKEREAFWKAHDKQWFSLPFNIWEN